MTLPPLSFPIPQNHKGSSVLTSSLGLPHKKLQTPLHHKLHTSQDSPRGPLCKCERNDFSEFCQGEVGNSVPHIPVLRDHTCVLLHKMCVNFLVRYHRGALGLYREDNDPIGEGLPNPEP